MKKIFYSAILLVGMLLSVSAKAQTSILPLSSDDLFKAYDNYQKGIYAKAYETFKSLSDYGDAQAAYGLGICYYNGKGTTKNIEEAFKCFEKSYNRGNKSAAFIIGKCYFDGQGVEKDFDKAEMYLSEAVNQGNMEAKALLLKINTEELELERKKMIADVAVVDLGLPSRTLWATTNIGAANPWDYGDYFAWGETTTKSKYDWSTLKYCLDNNGDKFSKYNTQSNYGSVDNKTTLERSDDAAYQNWGSDWCMPTLDQIKELKEKCKWVWTTDHGVTGYKVTGPNGNSLFLPAAGYRRGTDLCRVGSSGYYWSRSLNESCPYDARSLWFTSSNVDWGSGGRFFGRPVRPVRCR